MPFIKTPRRCQIPPRGWKCKREYGHSGPCAAVRDYRFLPGALFILGLLVLFALLFLFAVKCDGQTTAHYSYASSPTGKVYLPDHTATPGAVDPTLTVAKLCNKAFHTASARHVTRSEKVQACRAYGQLTGCPGHGYELDHLISIELGGSNNIKNLWPQPVDAPGTVGYHTKDVVENRAHAAVCSGRLTLKQAQQGISGNWYTFGKGNGFIE